MIRVVLPAHLRNLARSGGEVELAVADPVTQRTVLDALEAAYPTLQGTVRDHVTQQRRPFVRFFACGEDLSHDSPDTPLPPAIVSGQEPFLIVGAIAGGSDKPKASRKSILTGRILSGLVIVFLLWDAGMKAMRAQVAVEGTIQLGFPAGTVAGIGLALLFCTILYAIPRTSVLGAILLTGYMGGAVAVQVRVGNPWLGFTLFPVYFAVLLWGALYLRNEKLRELIPFGR